MMLVAIFFALRYPIDERVHRLTLDGIAAHRRGAVATDPITGNPVPPPSDRGLDEETSWFLDHFSIGELKRAARRGAGLVYSLRRDASLALGISALTVLGAGLGTNALFDLSSQPGVGVLSLVLLGGVSLTGIGFHAVRVRAAKRAGTVTAEAVAQHLEVTERLVQAGAMRRRPRATRTLK